MIQAGTISTGSAAQRRRRRRVLDQFDQCVAKDDLAGRRREFRAKRETVG